jgi:hypothetical protein
MGDFRRASAATVGDFIVQQVQALRAGANVSTDEIITNVRREFRECEHTDDDVVELLVGVASAYRVPVVFDHNIAGRRPARHPEWPQRALGNPDKASGI